MSNRPRFRLTDLDLDEISQVVSGDDPTASIMIIKNSPLEKMTGPSGSSLTTDTPLSSEFKHKDKLKGRRKKSGKKMRSDAMSAIDRMGEEDEYKMEKMSNCSCKKSKMHTMPDGKKMCDHCGKSMRMMKSERTARRSLR
jgi:hypothetical protein